MHLSPKNTRDVVAVGDQLPLHRNAELVVKEVHAGLHAPKTDKRVGRGGVELGQAQMSPNFKRNLSFWSAIRNFEKFTASYWRCKKFPARTYALRHLSPYRLARHVSQRDAHSCAECSLNDVYKRLHQPT